MKLSFMILSTLVRKKCPKRDINWGGQIGETWAGRRQTGVNYIKE